MHSVFCLIPASNTQHVELGRVKGRRREEEEERRTLFYTFPIVCAPLIPKTQDSVWKAVA
jgi:hypothetical protein